MRNTVMSFFLMGGVLSLANSLCPGGESQIPPRAYPDAYWTDSAKEEVYRGNDDWHIYYAGIDWENFLLYQMVLVKKGYSYPAGMPDSVRSYLDAMTIEPEPDGEVRLFVEKENWVALEVRYIPAGVESPGGMRSTMVTRILPGADFLAGKAGAVLKREDYAPYAEKRDERRRLRADEEKKR